jgi:hypothetical protein
MQGLKGQAGVEERNVTAGILRATSAEDRDASGSLGCLLSPPWNKQTTDQACVFLLEDKGCALNLWAKESYLQSSTRSERAGACLDKQITEVLLHPVDCRCI